jgi:hypothetical protein
MDKAFSRCRVSKIFNSYAFRDLVVRKTAHEPLDLAKPETLTELKNQKITGYVFDVEVISKDDANSLVMFIPNELNPHQSNQRTISDPWIKFRFRIYHVNTKAKVLQADIRVKSTTFIVGKNVDEDIGINRGLNTKSPTHEFQKALKKLTKICHCK